MKRLLLLACAYGLGIIGHAQTLTLHNATPFSVSVFGIASDGAGPASTCNQQYITNQIVLPPGGTYVATAADLTAPPASSPFYWTYVRYFDTQFPMCWMGSAGPCLYGYNNVGEPSCGFPANTCMTLPVCSPGAGHITNAAWGSSSPIDFIAKFFP